MAQLFPGAGHTPLKPHYSFFFSFCLRSLFISLLAIPMYFKMIPCWFSPGSNSTKVTWNKEMKLRQQNLTQSWKQVLSGEGIGNALARRIPSSTPASHGLCICAPALCFHLTTRLHLPQGVNTLSQHKGQTSVRSFCTYTSDLPKCWLWDSLSLEL